MQGVKLCGRSIVPNQPTLDPPQVSDAGFERAFAAAIEGWNSVPEGTTAQGLRAALQAALPHLRPERLKHDLEECEDRFEFCDNCERPAREEDLKVVWCKDAESGEAVDARICLVCRLQEGLTSSGSLAAFHAYLEADELSWRLADHVLAGAIGAACSAALNQDTEERDRGDKP